jgi:electron transport complex protein RnfE
MNPDTGPTPSERFVNGILPENPVFRQLLGLCPVLAVTASLASALTMSAAVMFVLLCANVCISLIRHLLRPHVRIVVFTLIIAGFVTLVDLLMGAFFYPMSKLLGPYLPLIIVNCIIICRCEVCASRQTPVHAAADAVGQGLGFTLALGCLGAVRELLGAGSLLGIRVLPEIWPDQIVMILPPGAFFAFGLLLAGMNAVRNARAARALRSTPKESPLWKPSEASC